MGRSRRQKERMKRSIASKKITLVRSEVANEMIAKLAEKHNAQFIGVENQKSVDCVVFIKGSFTVAMINGMYIGACKYNPEDKNYNENKGVMIAINRAAHDYFEESYELQPELAQETAQSTY